MNTIQIHETLAGRDVLLLLTGGSAHIGSVSTAYYGSDGQIEVQTTVLPGHKEHMVSEGMALKAAEELGTTVSVTAGIHYDHLTVDQIREITEIAWKKFEEYLLEASKRRYS